MKMTFFFITKLCLGLYEEIVNFLFSSLFPPLLLESIFTFLGKKNQGEGTMVRVAESSLLTDIFKFYL